MSQKQLHVVVLRCGMPLISVELGVGAKQKKRWWRRVGVGVGKNGV